MHCERDPVGPVGPSANLMGVGGFNFAGGESGPTKVKMGSCDCKLTRVAALSKIAHHLAYYKRTHSSSVGHCVHLLLVQTYCCSFT